VRSLGLRTYTQWRQYASSGEKPHDIPYDPYNVYAQSGWAGWGDWLGTGAIASYLRKYRSFKDARALVRRLGLKSHTEWQEYCRSGKKPSDIPSTPHSVYADAAKPHRVTADRDLTGTPPMVSTFVWVVVAALAASAAALTGAKIPAALCRTR